MAVEFKRILLTENPSLGFQENDLNPFKDATFQPTLEAAMEEQKIQLTTCSKFSTLLPTEN